MADPVDPILQELKDFLGVRNISKMAAKSSWDWFTGKTKEVMSGNKIMQQNPERLRNSSRLGQPTIGQMIMFFYDPTTKEKLKYYDRYPLIFQIGVYPDGFLGINLHYLRPLDRAKLLMVLYQTKTSPKSAEMKLKITYEILKELAGAEYYKPCIKRYLYVGSKNPGGVKSRFYVVEPKDWVKTLALPIERFERGGKGGGQVGSAVDKNEVWNDSNRTARPNRFKAPSRNKSKKKKK